MKEVVLYTDGACSYNPGPGGWAYNLMCESKTVKASGFSGLSLLSTKVVKGYKPYKAKITYTKMTKKEKKVIMNPLF